MRCYLYRRVQLILYPHVSIYTYTTNNNNSDITNSYSDTPQMPQGRNNNNDKNKDDDSFLDAIRTGTIGSGQSFTSQPIKGGSSGNRTSSSSSKTLSLSLDLDFTKMDFKSIVSSTQRAINKELQARGAASTAIDNDDDNKNPRYQRKLGVTVASDAAGGANIAHGVDVVNNQSQQSGLNATSSKDTTDDDFNKINASIINRYSIEQPVRVTRNSFIDALRDYRLSSDWSGALSLFSNAITAPNDYRHWYIQHLKIVLDMLLFSGKMEEAWKVWRLGIATEKLHHLNEDGANGLLFRLGRLSLLREIIELQVETGKLSNESRLGNAIDETASLNKSVQQKVDWWGQVSTELLQHMITNNFSVHEKNTEVKELIESKDHLQALTSFVTDMNTKRNVFLANRMTEHQNLVNAGIPGSISDYSKLNTAESDDAQHPDPTDVYELNDFITRAETTEEVDRLLSYANNNGIAPNCDTYGLRVKKLALRRRGYIRGNGPEPPQIAMIWQEALALFNEGTLRNGVEGKPTIALCNATLAEMRKAGRFEELQKIESIMRGESGAAGGDGDYWEIAPSSKSVDHIMATYYREQDYNKCKSMFEEMKLNYAAKLSPLVYTIMIKIQTMETAPRKDKDGKFVFPANVTDEQRAQGITPRSAAIEAHHNLTNLVSEMVKDNADGGLRDSANIALINAWTHSRQRRGRHS
eukprot:Tbor_TRINITY_DN5826_c2_g1::TRINITY_DN5826_c2_g1_i1::g.6088::m.6088